MAVLGIVMDKHICLGNHSYQRTLLIYNRQAA